MGSKEGQNSLGLVGHACYLNTFRVCVLGSHSPI